MLNGLLRAHTVYIYREKSFDYFTIANNAV